MRADPLLDVVGRLRPPPTRVWTIGELADETARLEAAGYSVASWTEGSPPAELVLASHRPLAEGIEEGLDRLRSLLAPDGHLLLLAELAWGVERPDDTVAAAELVASLYERGFALLGRTILDPSEPDEPTPPLYRDGPVRRELVVARRDEHRIRGFAPGDETAILELFHEAFPHERRSLADWSWRYRDHPDGGPFTSLAVDPDDRIGAHYAGYPVRFLDATGPTLRRFTAYQIGDTMTAHWAHGVGGRRTGLLTRATQHFFHRRCAHRIAFNYGFNTGKIHRFYLRLVPGSEYLEPVPFRVLELAGHRPAPPGLRDRLLGGLRVERVTSIDERDRDWDRLCERAAPGYRLLAERDARHLRWRYFARPEASYLLLAVRRRGRLVGWGAFRREEDRLVWGDALFLPERSADAAALLDAALALPEAAGVRRVEGWFPERPAFWDATLAELGFERRPEPRQLALIYMEFEERGLGPRFARDLYYTLAESDLF